MPKCDPAPFRRPDSFVFAIDASGVELVATRCANCQGLGSGEGLEDGCGSRHVECGVCHGYGYFDITPHLPTIAPPGTAERVAVYMARYRAGISLWNESDCDRDSIDTRERQWTPLKSMEKSMEKQVVTKRYVADDDDEDDLLN